VDKRQEIIQEIQRIARELGKDSITLQDFKRYSTISEKKVTYHFGRWNDAVIAAGLQANTPNLPPARDSFSDDDLLAEIGRLWQQLGNRPTIQMMNAKGSYSAWPYQSRWGSFPKAVDEYVRLFGEPVVEEITPCAESVVQVISQSPFFSIPKTVQQKGGRLTPAHQFFGEPIDFRGLRYAPINEQGVVYLFGMVSRELGFLVESIRTAFPDCEGKRALDKTGEHWQHVRIEFEYRSKNFVEHGHDPEACDLIVCWIHDWADCPLEILELKSTLAKLPNR
jgi:hypothetical protein